MKTSIILPLLALSVRVLAVPPACLLNAVNTQDDPSDLSAICGSEAQDVQAAIASGCGNNQKVAQSAFIATCSSAGSSVAPYTATATKGSHTSGTFVYTTAVYDPACSCTTTIVTSATGGIDFGSQSATATGASQTGNVAADIKGMGNFAAAAVAVAGAIAAL